MKLVHFIGIIGALILLGCEQAEPGNKMLNSVQLFELERGKANQTEYHTLSLFYVVAEQWWLGDNAVIAQYPQIKHSTDAHEKAGTWVLPEKFEWPWTADWLTKLGNVPEEDIYFTTVCMKYFEKEGYRAEEPSGIKYPDASKVAVLKEVPFYYGADQQMKTVEGYPVVFGMPVPLGKDVWFVIHGDDRIRYSEPYFPRKATMPPNW